MVTIQKKTVSLTPPSGEHQPPLSSDSDTSLITGMEVGVSEVELSMEQEREVTKSWPNQSWSRQKKDCAGQFDQGCATFLLLKDVTSQNMRGQMSNRAQQNRYTQFTSSVGMLLLAVAARRVVDLTVTVTRQPVMALTLKPTYCPCSLYTPKT